MFIITEVQILCIFTPDKALRIATALPLAFSAFSSSTKRLWKKKKTLRVELTVVLINIKSHRAS